MMLVMCLMMIKDLRLVEGRISMASFFLLLLLSILLLKCPERSLSCARHSASVAYKAIFISDNYFAAAA